MFLPSLSIKREILRNHGASWALRHWSTWSYWTTRMWGAWWPNVSIHWPHRASSPDIGPFGPIDIGPFGPPIGPGPDIEKCDVGPLIVVMFPPTGPPLPPFGPPDIGPGREHIGPDSVHIGPPGTFIGPQGPLIDIGTLEPHIEFGVLQLGNMGEPALFSIDPGLLNLGKKSKLGGPLGPPIELFWGRAGKY
ncbi:hypothetical protein Avbf_00932 [Armadillidium vulgare]|nr:hypothetical protein Avbf_00932 [Armadillidium vulgare]